MLQCPRLKLVPGVDSYKDPNLWWRMHGRTNSHCERMHVLYKHRPYEVVVKNRASALEIDRQRILQVVRVPNEIFADWTRAIARNS